MSKQVVPEVARNLIMSSVNLDLANDTQGPDINEMPGTMARMEDFKANNDLGLFIVLMVGANRKTGEMSALFELGGTAPTMLVAGSLMSTVIEDHVTQKTPSCGCEGCVTRAILRAVDHMNSSSVEKLNG